MTTLKGEIARSEPERTNEQLSGRVWLAQNRGKWPVTLMTTQSEAIHWLQNNPDGAVWVYHVTPVHRVTVVTPDPYLVEMQQPEPLPEAAEVSPNER